MTFWIELRCWFYFRHLMESLGKCSGCEMFQCRICAKTIAVDQSKLTWR